MFTDEQIQYLSTHDLRVIIEVTLEKQYVVSIEDEEGGWQAGAPSLEEAIKEAFVRMQKIHCNCLGLSHEDTCPHWVLPF